jgi:hypothetical protein
MKFFLHNEQEAVAQCNSCHKGLCGACAAKYEPPLCDHCFQKLSAMDMAQAKARIKTIRWTQVKMILMLVWASFFIFTGIWGSLTTNQEGKLIILSIYFGVAGLFFLLARAREGRQTTAGQLSAIQSNISFLALCNISGTAGLMVMLMVMVLSFALSVIVTPIFYVLTIRDLFKLRREKKELLNTLANAFAERSES